MAAEEEVRARLTGDPALAALVGPRVHAVRAPQAEAPPFVVHRRISAVDMHALDGRTDLREGRFQVDCYARTHAEALALARAVRNAMTRVNSETLHAEVAGEIDQYEDGEPKLHRRILDFVTMERD